MTLIAMAATAANAASSAGTAVPSPPSGPMPVTGMSAAVVPPVSVAVAWAMAQGCLANSSADVAVSITGIAGPGGGSAKKPVGTVVFACASRDGDPDKVVADVEHFGDIGRHEIRRQAALVALQLLMP